MRYKVSNSEVCHMWAHQSQDHAEGGTIFFVDQSIYSYGVHFEMARWIDVKGKRAILFTTRTYSMTTSGHLAEVRRAIPPDVLVFHVPLTSRATDANAYLAYYRATIHERVMRASRARSNREWLLSSARGLADEANKLAQFFGSRKRIKLPSDFSAMLAEAKALSDKIAKRDRIKREQQRKEAERRNAAAKAEAVAAAAEWMTGQRHSIPGVHLLDGALLRLIDDGKTVQTSMGAQFPSDHGQRAYRVLARLHSRAAEYHRNGHTIHVGNYAVDSLDSLGNIRAGCHRLQWSEVQRLAHVAGWSVDDDGNDPNNAEHDRREENRTGGNEAPSDQPLSTGHDGTGQSSEGDAI